VYCKSPKITKEKLEEEDEEEPPWYSLHRFSQERSLHLKRKHRNLYSSAAGDWLTFTSPVERRRREWRREARGGGRRRVWQAQQEDGCVWGGGRADAAGWKALQGLQTDAGWPSASRPDWKLELRGRSGSTDMKLAARRWPIWLNLSNISN